MDQDELLRKAKDLSNYAQLDYEPSTLRQCNCKFFYDVYKSLTGRIINWTDCCSDGMRCQMLVNSMEQHLFPYIKLDHIKGHNLAKLDFITVQDMLDVFLMLFKTPLSNMASGTTPFVCQQMSPPKQSSLMHSKEYVLQSLLSSYCRDALTNDATDLQHRYTGDDATMPTNILHQTEHHFPFMYVEPSTLRKLEARQLQQSQVLSQPKCDLPPSLWKSIHTMYQKQGAMLKLLQKDLVHTRSVKEAHDKLYCEQYMKTALHERRLAAARARRCYQGYEMGLRSKLLAARTQEEQTYIKAFENGLKFYKETVLNKNREAKERHLVLKSQICEKLEAMEQGYHCILGTIAGATKLQQQKLECDKDNYKQKLYAAKRRIQDIEREIKTIQSTIDKGDIIQHFRELDANSIRWNNPT